jgi:hypothetical protein
VNDTIKLKGGVFDPPRASARGILAKASARYHQIEGRCFMAVRQISLGRLFVQEVIKAGTWGVVLLLIFGILIMSIKQEIKEGIAYGVDRVVNEAVMVVTDPYLIGKSKQLIKEGIEYTLAKTAKEIRGILEDYDVEIEIEEKDEAK